MITVDWGIGAVFPLYNNASSNTRIVARQTCLLVKMIRKVFYQDMWSKDFNIHCIGHSLGGNLDDRIHSPFRNSKYSLNLAHTCGFASSECGSMFDRVTGNT